MKLEEAGYPKPLNWQFSEQEKRSDLPLTIEDFADEADDIIKDK